MSSVKVLRAVFKFDCPYCKLGCKLSETHFDLDCGHEGYGLCLGHANPMCKEFEKGADEFIDSLPESIQLDLVNAAIAWSLSPAYSELN